MARKINKFGVARERGHYVVYHRYTHYHTHGVSLMGVDEQTWLSKLGLFRRFTNYEAAEQYCEWAAEWDNPHFRPEASGAPVEVHP